MHRGYRRPPSGTAGGARYERCRPSGDQARWPRPRQRFAPTTGGPATNLEELATKLEELATKLEELATNLEELATNLEELATNLGAPGPSLPAPATNLGRAGPNQGGVVARGLPGPAERAPRRLEGWAPLELATNPEAQARRLQALAMTGV